MPKWLTSTGLFGASNPRACSPVSLAEAKKRAKLGSSVNKILLVYIRVPHSPSGVRDRSNMIPCSWQPRSTRLGPLAPFFAASPQELLKASRAAAIAGSIDGRTTLALGIRLTISSLNVFSSTLPGWVKLPPDATTSTSSSSAYSKRR